MASEFNHYGDGSNLQYEQLAKRNEFLEGIIGQLRADNEALRRSNEELKLASYTDIKTGLSSYKYFKEFIIPEMQNYIDHLSSNRRSGGYDLAFGILDINAMNLHNSDLGHDGGDELLANVGRLLAEAVRENDWVGRFGDSADEFCILLRAPLGSSVETIIHTVQNRIDKNLSSIAIGHRPVSISMGFVPVALCTNAGTAVAVADRIMYDNKNAWKAAQLEAGNEFSRRLGNT